MEGKRQRLKMLMGGIPIPAMVNGRTCIYSACILLIMYILWQIPMSVIMLFFSLMLFFRDRLPKCIIGRKDLTDLDDSIEVDLTCLGEILNSDGQHIQDHQENIKLSPVPEVIVVLEELGLSEYYPSKISLQDVMAVQSRSCSKQCDVPWLILQKLIMLDFRGRESDLGKSSPMATDSRDNHEGFAFDEFVENISSEGNSDSGLSPLDIFITIYACCDMVLKQILVQKMFSCRLAVPFISPQLSDGGLLYSLWALRSIVVEWKNKDQVCMETSVVSRPVKTVSFLRLGKLSSSKSALLNNVLSDQPHHTFWNRECPLGASEHPLANGLVEAQWYLPSGLPEDIFEDVTMFLNLRGEACEHKRQLQVLENISNAVVCCVDPADLESSVVRETMKRIHESSAKVVLLLQMKELDGQKLRKQLEEYFNYVGSGHKATTKMISTLKGKKERTMEDLKQELRKVLNGLLVQDGQSIEDASTMASKAGIAVDEEDKFCMMGKDLAEQVRRCIEITSTSKCKQEMLPLQGESWEKWSRLLRAQQNAGGKDMKSNTMDEVSKIATEMKVLRRDQLKHCTNLSTLVKTFLQNLIEVKDSPGAILYLQWVKIYLDEMSRKSLPDLHRQYHEKWRELTDSENKATQKSGKTSDEGNQLTTDAKRKVLEGLRKELTVIEQTLVDASLGVEHLLREVGQIYEAAHNNRSMKQAIEKLPNVVANLMLKGHPMEIMDGDAANVPLTWVNAVFSSLEHLLGDSKLFVISVLGIQSSGKSTLLNTMFGLQFAVSAGRCTRGVYMQLIKVDKERSDLPYDFVLIIDTEGLRAPELAQQKHDNDNQLATFVIGLGDLTLLNIKGENVSDISDVLQIAVHAFLRMKISENNFQPHRTCYFIHQNVPAINAKLKTQQGRKKLQEKLDKMTVEACTMENIIDIQFFNQVISFDTETNVLYFPDLWYGNPPMAPVNTGYTTKVQEVRDHLLYQLAQERQTYLTFSDMSLHVKDLWRAVLSENFVFSFRNSLAAKAYNVLERTYHEKSWIVESQITEWLTKTAAVKLERCRTKDELDAKHSELLTELTKMGCDLQGQVCSEFEDYIDSNNLKDILIEWKTQKMNSLQIDINSFLDTARGKLLQEKDNVVAKLHQNAKLADMDGEIMQKARQFAKETKGQRANDNQLEMMFNRFWTESVAELIPRTTETSMDIETTVERLLYRLLNRDKTYLRKELERQPVSVIPAIKALSNSIKLEDVKESDLSIGKTSWMQQKKHVKQVRTKAVSVINTILGTVDGYLSDISSQDSDFQEAYATNVIKIVVDGLDKHNTMHTTEDFFTILPNLTVRIVVHACCHAMRTFNKMAATYKERHSVFKRLDTKKAAAWSLFRNTVKQCASEVIAADLFIAHLETLIRKAVQRDMTVKVVNEIVRYFSYQKFSLLIKIFDDLAEGSFYRYRSFLNNSKGFGLEWITSFTKKEVFHTKDDDTSSKYVDFATEGITKLVKSTVNAIKTTNTAVKRQRYPDIKEWVNKFCSTLEELPVTKQDLQQMTKENVKDFENLEKLLLEKLATMENNLLSVFKAERAGSIKWEGTTPYKQILDRLWGCEAQCPFCEEVCNRTDPNHLSPNDSHQCIQHRPQGVSGVHHELNKKLVTEACGFKVQSGLDFYCLTCRSECKKSGKCNTENVKVRHPFKEYKKFLPDWDIAPSPNMESSKYWLWLMATYKNELADWYNAKVPDVPSAWHRIRKQEALDSLRVHYN